MKSTKLIFYDFVSFSASLSYAYFIYIGRHLACCAYLFHLFILPFVKYARPTNRISQIKEEETSFQMLSVSNRTEKCASHKLAKLNNTLTIMMIE